MTPDVAVAWAAFERILHDVEQEMPQASEEDQYREYRVRCAKWKRDRGIKLSARDVHALSHGAGS